MLKKEQKKPNLRQTYLQLKKVSIIAVPTNIVIDLLALQFSQVPNLFIYLFVSHLYLTYLFNFFILCI